MQRIAVQEATNGHLAAGEHKAQVARSGQSCLFWQLVGFAPAHLRGQEKAQSVAQSMKRHEAANRGGGQADRTAQCRAISRFRGLGG